jgi:MFS transporter, DHA1 family, tetracycline resistance protein
MPAEVLSDAAGKTRHRADLALLLVVVFINIAGFSLVLPLLPFYGQAFGASPFGVASLFAAYSFGNLFGESYWGRLSDRIGRRRVLMASTACSALGYVAFAFAPNLAAALILRVVSGFFGGTLSVALGNIADLTAPEQRARNMGFFGAAFNLGFVLGPAMGGLLAVPELGAAGYRLPLYAAGALSAAASLWAWLFLREPVRSSRRAPGPLLTGRETLRFALGHGLIARLLLIGFVAVLTFASMEAVFGLWTGLRFGWGPREVGLAFIAVGLAGGITQALLIGPLARRFGEARVLTTGVLVLLASTLLMPFSSTPAMSVALMALLMTGHSLTFPNLGALISRSTSPDNQGALMGLQASVQAFGRISGPPILGWTFGAIAPGAPFLLAAGLVAIAVVLAIGVVKLAPSRGAATGSGVSP